jgi:exopolysaccharide production protein ExoY
VTSKTVSELANLSANLPAFDVPVNEGGQPASSLEPARARERWPSHFPLIPKPANGHRTLNSNLSVVISAAGVVDSFAPDVDLLGDRGGSPPLGGWTKRALDIVIAAAAIVLLAPLMLAVSLLIYATMGRPIFFPQRRIGYQGRSFACLKFRTMVQDAEAALRLHVESNPAAAHEWRKKQKLRHDPRVTPVGRILRLSSIDELPQLACVLLGHMSCVGPRPVVETEINRYGEYWKEYVKARPGVTGLWQVSGRNRLSYQRRVALDRYYVRKWSVWRDLWILIKTIPAVLKTDDTA